MIDVSHDGNDGRDDDGVTLVAARYHGFVGGEAALRALHRWRDGLRNLGWLKAHVCRDKGRFIVIDDLVDIGKNAVLFNKVADNFVRRGLQKIGQIFDHNLCRYGDRAGWLLFDGVDTSLWWALRWCGWARSARMSLRPSIRRSSRYTMSPAG